MKLWGQALAFPFGNEFERLCGRLRLLNVTEGSKVTLSSQKLTAFLLDSAAFCASSVSVQHLKLGPVWAEHDEAF